jgi:hypothetical protein
MQRSAHSPLMARPSKHSRLWHAIVRARSWLSDAVRRAVPKLPPHQSPSGCRCTTRVRLLIMEPGGGLLCDCDVERLCRGRYVRRLRQP